MTLRVLAFSLLELVRQFVQILPAAVLVEDHVAALIVLEHLKPQQLAVCVEPAFLDVLHVKYSQNF